MRRRTNPDLPPPPELPSFTVEPEADTADRDGRDGGRSRGERGDRGERSDRGERVDRVERHDATGLQRHDAPLDAMESALLAQIGAPSPSP